MPVVELIQPYPPDERINLVSQIHSTNIIALDKALAAIRSPYINHKWKAWTVGMMAEKILSAIHTIRMTEGISQ